MAFCNSKGGIPYFETSAKEAINVEQAFEGRISPLFGCQFPLTSPRSYRAPGPCAGGGRRLQPGLPRDDTHQPRSRPRRLRVLGGLGFSVCLLEDTCGEDGNIRVILVHGRGVDLEFCSSWWFNKRFKRASRVSDAISIHDITRKPVHTWAMVIVFAGHACLTAAISPSIQELMRRAEGSETGTPTIETGAPTYRTQHQMPDPPLRIAHLLLTRSMCKTRSPHAQRSLDPRRSFATFIPAT